VPIIFKSADLSVSPAAAWRIVDRYMSNDIHVFSTAEKQRMEGAWRIVTSEGVEYRELNVTVDPEHMFASYTVPDVFGSNFHHASMRVFDTGDGGCRFEWITDVDSGTYAAEHADLYDVLWADLVKVVETGEEAPWPAAAAE
jgi:hypothetical protein